jgi:DNA-binding CsgD family transcriptional regulator/GAF domain-containing protein
MAEVITRSAGVADVIAQTREILRMTEATLGTSAIGPTVSGAEMAAADSALSAARRALGARLESAGSAGEHHPEPHVAAMMMRAEQTQLALKDALLAAQRDEIESAQAAVHGLRATVSTTALAEQIPAQAYRMGFTRVLFSHIKQGTWLACSAFAGDDREMAYAMVQAGATNPRRLVGPLLECEMVRRGQPILVRNPQTDPRVHAELVAVTKTASYVAAPVFSWGRAIGLVHADRHSDSYGVGEFDREALGIFAEGLGIAFERNLMIERLRAMRQAADEHLRVANALADDFTLEVMELAGPAPAGTDELFGRGFGDRGATTVHAPRQLSDLTSRETEVLRAIAAGKTNAQIATALFVTEGTVKSHVKHILRKLGASNRTEAVAKYHRAQNSPLPHSAQG